MSQPNHEPIYLAAGEFRADISPFGATLNRFRFGERDLILGLSDISGEALPYCGAIVGPIANRVTNGQVTIDGALYQMEQNEGGINALHSGSDGLHHLTWEVREQSESTVVLACHLPDGHTGLPGNRDITATYALDETGMTLTITAQTDRKTPMNIAHHAYWALEPDQSKTTMWIDADSYLPVDELLIPLGQTEPVAGTPFDFSTAREIGPESPLDHNWCLSSGKHETPRQIATVRASDGLQLNVGSTEVGLQIYTGLYIPELTQADCLGPQIRPNAGIAIEPQGWPDAVNNSGFPSIMLEKGENYRQITRYTVSKT